jgi:hypothetical protein
MSHSPLDLALTALAIAITAVALPAGATPPGTNGKLVFTANRRPDLFPDWLPLP